MKIQASLPYIIGAGIVGFTAGRYCNRLTENSVKLETPNEKADARPEKPDERPEKQIASKIKKSDTSNSKPPLVLIACGSFSPITNMHLRLFEEARNFLRNDFDVRLGIISPTNDGYKQHKSSLIHSAHRINMAELAVVDSGWIEINDYEVRQSEWQRTRPTLTYYKEQLMKNLSPDVEVRYLCGADILEAMCKPNSLWKAEDVQYILKEFGIAAICRKDAPDLHSYIREQDLLRPYADRIHLITPEVENNISSSLIRRLLKQGKSISFLVPDSVEEYIYANKLFVRKKESKL